MYYIREKEGKNENLKKEGKMRNSILCVHKQPISMLYFEFENDLKFYNLRARFVSFDIKSIGLPSSILEALPGKLDIKRHSPGIYNYKVVKDATAHMNHYILIY